MKNPMINSLFRDIRNRTLFDILKARLSQWGNSRFDRFISHYVNNHQLVEGTIVIMSRPDYSDNAKALSEYMRDNDYFDRYRVYWLVADKKSCENKYPDAGVTFLQMYNWAGIYKKKTLEIYLTAQRVMATHVFYVPKALSNKEQKRYLLWHGCGYKDKGWTQFIPNNFDKVCVSGPLFIESKKKYWGIDESVIIAKGYPRYDWIESKSRKAALFRNQICGNNSKVIIWMPTFRNAAGFQEQSISEFPIMSNRKDWETLNEYCNKKKVLLLIKLHMYQKEYRIDFSSFSNIVRITNTDFSDNNIELYEFLAYTDGLITDYSSTAIDYLLVDKPIAFALDDYDAYKSSRGFVFEDPRVYMPGHKLYNLNDLLLFINDCSHNNDPFEEERHCLRDIAIYKSGNYCKEILETLDIR